MEQALRFRRGDVLAILLVLAAAAAMALGLAVRAAPGPVTAHIYREGRLVARLPLDRDGSYAVDGDYHNTVTVQNGAVAVTDSDCPGGDCLHSGWVSASGRSIVCLPNRMEVRLVGGAAGDVDIVLG